MGPGGLWWSSFLNLALPPWRLRPDSSLEHQDPVSHTAQKKREKKERKQQVKIVFKLKKIIKINKSTNDNKCYKLN